MPPALPVVRITAEGRNRGKTTLSASIISQLRERGYLVAAVKHSHHPIQPDTLGKDTEVFARSGASRVAFIGSDGTLERRFGPQQSLTDVVEDLVGTVDFVIAEGFKEETLGAEIRLDGVPPAGVVLTSMDGRVLLRTHANDVDAIIATLESEFCTTAAGDATLNRLIRRASQLHGHFCPGIVLGVRMALAGLSFLGANPQHHRHGLAVTVRSARCFADAIASTAGCSPGRRNFIVEDVGDTVAVFTNRETGASVRVEALDSAKGASVNWVPEGTPSRLAQAIAYRSMPDDQLLEVSPLYQG